MIFDWSDQGKVHVDMTTYVENMVDEFPVKFKKTETAATPAAEDLFQKGNGKTLEKSRQEAYHTTVAKGLFVSKRARPDIHPTIAVLCTRVKEPNEADWTKLIRLLKYLNGTRKDVLTLSAKDLRVIKWSVDVAFAVHPDFKSHTGGATSFGVRVVSSTSAKKSILRAQLKLK